MLMATTAPSVLVGLIAVFVDRYNRKMIRSARISSGDPNF
jgi:hypothetical protein